MGFSDRVIIASGLADQSYLHIYKRSLNGWSISNPEKINLSSILRSDGNFIDKNFTGFSHMVYVTVSRSKYFMFNRLSEKMIFSEHQIFLEDLVKRGCFGTFIVLYLGPYKDYLPKNRMDYRT